VLPAPLLETIAAEVGTPFYAYDLDLFRERIGALERELAGVDHVVCYAVKANDALAILATAAQAGLGADVVSGGELAKARRAGFQADRIVFSGVGKQQPEIDAALVDGIGSLNVEAIDELDDVADAARRLGTVAPVSVRLNPDVAAGTHRHLTTGTGASKFGLGREEALAAFHAAAEDPALEPVGLSFHVGSQLLDTEPIFQAAEQARELWAELAEAGIRLRDLDIGGGLGIAYEGQVDPDVAAYARNAAALARSLGATLLLEPGRHLVGPVGTFVTRIVRVKHAADRTIAVCDGGSNDLIRPLLYGAEHPIRVMSGDGRVNGLVDVVGPLCESGDFLTLGRTLPLPVRGDLLAVEFAGAYGRVMSSTYNARPLCAEVVLEGGAWRIGRTRGTVGDLFRNERI
jgi:diaminopimelate decarboxylase